MSKNLRNQKMKANQKGEIKTSIFSFELLVSILPFLHLSIYFFSETGLWSFEKVSDVDKCLTRLTNIQQK